MVRAASTTEFNIPSSLFAGDKRFQIKIYPVSSGPVQIHPAGGSRSQDSCPCGHGRRQDSVSRGEHPQRINSCRGSELGGNTTVPTLAPLWRHGNLAMPPFSIGLAPRLGRVPRLSSPSNVSNSLFLEDAVLLQEIHDRRVCARRLLRVESPVTTAGDRHELVCHARPIESFL